MGWLSRGQQILSKGHMKLNEVKLLPRKVYAPHVH